MHGTVKLDTTIRDALRDAIVEHFGSIPGIAEQVAKLRRHRATNPQQDPGNWQDMSVGKTDIEGTASQIRRFLRTAKRSSSRNLPTAFLRDFRVAFAALKPSVSVDEILALKPQMAGEEESDDAVPDSLRDLILGRDATMRSLEQNAALEDKTHRYSLVHRIDQLDYPTEDFFSVRRLVGRNETQRFSPFLLYRECSENKLRFEELGVQALDLKSGQTLRIEPQNDSRRLSFEHPFRICFNEPLRPNQEFDIVYAIRLPRELEVIPAADEIMSVSLRRMILGVEKLVFEVCLDFRPSSFLPACLLETRRIVVPAKLAIGSMAYAPISPWERNMGLKKWSCRKPWRVSLTVEKPERAVYIINYKR